LHATIILLSLALPSIIVGQTPGAKLQPGDIIYADSGNAIDGGFVIKVNPATGQKSVISSGASLRLPFDLVVDAQGQILVSDSGRLLRIAPDTGAQSMLAANSSGLLGLPYGLALNRSGDLIAANLRTVVQVDALNGQVQTVSAAGKFVAPLGVAVATDGQLLVLDVAAPSQVIRVNPQTGNQRVVSEGGYLKRPQAIAVQGKDIYVTDVATPDGNFGIGRIIHIDAQSGDQAVVAEGGNLVGPVGITVDDQGQLIVGDPYTIDPSGQSLDSGGYQGAIIRIDPLSGAQTLLTRGDGGAVNPRGVAIVPSAGPRR
jgi:sugar lactone lactonase YvrE